MGLLTFGARALLCQALNGEPAPSVLTLDEPIAAIKWSPDGKLLATVSSRREKTDDKEIDYCTFKLWDARTGKLKVSLGEIPNPGVNMFAFSPDSAMLAISMRLSIEGGDKVELWDVQSGGLKRTIKADYGRSRLWFAFSPDSKVLALAYGGPSTKIGGGARLFDVQTGELTQTLLGHEYLAISVAFSPDGSLLATGGYKGEIVLWNLAKGESVRTLEGTGAPVSLLTFSPDGKTLIGGGSEELLLWSIQSGKAKPFQTGDGRISTVLFSPDGKLVATAGPVDRNGKQVGQVKLWEAATGKLLRTWSDTSSSGVAFTDGKSLAILHADKTLKVWDIKQYAE